MRTNEGFVLRKVYGKALLMPVKRNEVGDDPIALNEVAAQIWELAFEKYSVDEIIGNVNQLYGLKKGSVEETAVRQFIAEMENMGLIFRD